MAHAHGGDRAPVPAAAATARVIGDRVSYVAAPGEANEVTVVAITEVDDGSHEDAVPLDVVLRETRASLTLATGAPRPPWTR